MLLNVNSLQNSIQSDFPSLDLDLLFLSTTLRRKDDNTGIDMVEYKNGDEIIYIPLFGEMMCVDTSVFYKNVNNLIKAFGPYKDQKAKLVIACSGDRFGLLVDPR